PSLGAAGWSDDTLTYLARKVTLSSSDFLFQVLSHPGQQKPISWPLKLTVAVPGATSSPVMGQTELTAFFLSGAAAAGPFGVGLESWASAGAALPRIRAVQEASRARRVVISDLR